jgi:hypothetical protein
MAAPAPEDQEECSGPADLVIFLSGTTTETQRLHLESVCIVRDPDGALLVNSAQPEEDQGTLVVDDFDFDGREDLAVQVSHKGSYGTPTFRILLGQAKPGEFAFSPELSKLDSLGLFQVDQKRKRLVTHAKSGCCFHLDEEHRREGSAAQSLPADRDPHAGGRRCDQNGDAGQRPLAQDLSSQASRGVTQVLRSRRARAERLLRVVTR